jgi:hypothetical protein
MRFHFSIEFKGKSWVLIDSIPHNLRTIAATKQSPTTLVTVLILSLSERNRKLIEVFEFKNYWLNEISKSYESQSKAIVYARTSSGLSIPMSVQNAVKLTTEAAPVVIENKTPNMLLIYRKNTKINF